MVEADLQVGLEGVEVPGRQYREDDQNDECDDRQPRPPWTLEQRAFRRRFDARLGRRVAASVADQRLVGDLSSTVCADHGGSDTVVNAEFRLQIVCILNSPFCIVVLHHL